MDILIDGKAPIVGSAISGGTIDGTPIGGTTPAAGAFTTGSFTGNVTIDAGLVLHKTDAGAADYNPSVLTTDYIITTNTNLGARAVIISTEDRDSGSVGNPRIFVIKDIAGNAGANNITISLETAGTIDGAATSVINANYNSITLLIDGTNGYII